MSKKDRKLYKERMKQLLDQKRQSAPSAPPEPPKLDLRFHNASTIVPRPHKSIQIVQAGCGGIGAYTAMHVGRVISVLMEQGLKVSYTLADPDIVEEKNLGRQYFCRAEIGVPKAIALARRFGQAWGLETTAFHGEYSDSLLIGADLTILVGCVDNTAARRDLHDTLAHNPKELHPRDLPRVWWLDCGNLKDTGRVLLGSAYGVEQVRGAFLPKQICIGLPSPALQYPSLLVPQKEERAEREMSCAELAAANLQSLNINAALAVQASDFLTRLLVTHDLKRYQCAVNMASGSTRSFYANPDEVAREVDKPVEFVIAQEERLAIAS